MLSQDKGISSGSYVRHGTRSQGGFFVDFLSLFCHTLVKFFGGFSDEESFFW